MAALDISVPALPGATKALQAATSAPLWTVIGAVLSSPAHQIGVAVPATLALVFNQHNRFALKPYGNAEVTGSSHTNTTLDGFSSSVLAAGWLPGHLIADDQGAFLPGTFIAEITADGDAVVLSQPARRSIDGLILTVTGSNLVTNWNDLIPVSNPIGQIQARYQGYVTSYFPFLVTVTDQDYFRITEDFIVRGTEDNHQRVVLP